MDWQQVPHCWWSWEEWSLSETCEIFQCRIQEICPLRPNGLDEIGVADDAKSMWKLTTCFKASTNWKLPIWSSILTSSILDDQSTSRIFLGALLWAIGSWCKKDFQLHCKYIFVSYSLLFHFFILFFPFTL